MSRIICWVLIAAAVGYIFIAVNILPSLRHAPQSREKLSDVVEDLNFHLAARMALGFRALQEAAAKLATTVPATSTPATPPIPSHDEPLMAALDQAAHTPDQHLRAAIVAGEVVGDAAATTRLRTLQDDDRLDAKNIERLREIYSGDGAMLSAEDRAALQNDLGWYAQLALTHGLPKNDPARVAALAPAQRTAIEALVLIILLFAAGAIGLILLIIAVILFSTGVLRRRYAPVVATRVADMIEPHRPRPPVFLEAFAIYLVGFLVIGFVLSRVLKVEGLAWSMLATILLPIAMLWPRLRGVSMVEIRAGFGYGGGAHPILEILSGIAGYLAGLPLIAISLLITLRLVKFAGAGAAPAHPIIQELSGGPLQLTLVFILACVWAPLMEETMFRGALYNHLRGRWNVLISSLIVGLIFASIHPQGWTTIPVLATIGMILAWIREWRGSIIASMTAHALNNAIALTVAVMLFRG